MTSPKHHHHLRPSSIRISSVDQNNKQASPISWLTESSSRSFSFLKVPPEDPKFFSKTSMIQVGYGVWISMTTLVTGLAIGFTTIALPQMQHEDSKIKITLSEETWIASVLTLCVPLGSLLGGIFMDVYGRQPVIVLCGIPVSLGWFFIGLAKTLNTFTIGCVIISVGLGMMLTAPRVYITEITLPNMRGVIGAMPYFFLTVGFVTVATLVVFIEWQTISYICGVYSIILMIFNCYLPETPHFLLLSSPEKTIKNLKRFRSKSFDVENELEMLIDYRDENNIRRLSLGEAIVRMFTPSVCKPLAISLAYILLMLCSGCVVVIMWTVEMLELSNAAIVSSTGNLIICVMRIAVGIMTSAILYKANRRVMAIISAAGVGCSAIGISIYLHTQVGRHITPFYFYMAYISFAVLGYYTLPLITMYEILPLQLRGVLSGINITLMNLIIFGMNTAYPYVREAIGLANLMAIFGGISLFGTIILYYILPETSEVTLQEIEEYFGSKRPTLVSSRIIRSDQFISMMKASSSQAQQEGMPIHKKSIRLNKKKTTEFKLNKDLNIVNKENPKYKKSERHKDEVSFENKISDRDKDIGGLKNKIYDKEQGSSEISFENEDQGGLKHKISDRHKDLGGSEDKLFDKDKEKSDLKTKISDKDKEGSVNKESGRDTDQGGLTNTTSDMDNQESSNDIKSDRGNDQISSKNKTPDKYKGEKDSEDKESVRTRGLINKETDHDTDQGCLTDQTFDEDEDQGSSKDKRSDIDSDQEGSVNKRINL